MVWSRNALALAASAALVTLLAGAADAQILETAWDRVSGGAAFHETFVKVTRI